MKFVTKKAANVCAKKATVDLDAINVFPATTITPIVCLAIAVDKAVCRRCVMQPANVHV